MSGELKVCIGNYGYYNEGELHDAWIELPKEPAEIKAFLKERRLFDPEHEEIYVSDYDRIPFGLGSVFTENALLSDLNMLAVQMGSIDYDEDAVLAYIDACCSPSSVVELMSLLEQADDIPFYRYEETGRTPRESMGLTAVAWNPELEAMLESDSSIAWAFDYEVYGESFEQQFSLSDEGYIDCCGDHPDLDAYDREDLEAMYGFEDEGDCEDDE